MKKLGNPGHKSVATRGALAFCAVTTLGLGACTQARELDDVAVETSVQAASASDQESSAQSRKPRSRLASLLGFLFHKHHGHDRPDHGGHDDDEDQCSDPTTPEPSCSFVDISAGMRTGPFAQLIFDTATANRVYGVAGGLLYVSDDGGVSFEARTVLSPAGLSVGRIAPIHGSDSLYALTNQGLARSDDGGLTYKLLSLKGLDIKALHVHPADPVQLYVSTYAGGLFRSTDGGRTFAAIAGGLHSGQNYAWDFSGDPLDRSVVLAALRDGPSDASTSLVFRSDSMGASWNPVPGTSFPTVLSRCASDPSTILAGAENKTGILISRDNGASFTLAPVPVPYMRTISGAVGGADCQVIYATAYQDSIYRSTDGGATFERVAANGIDLTWPSPREILIDPNDPSVVIARCDGGTYRSEDWGETFQLFGGQGTPSLTDVHATSDGSQLWVSTWGGGVYRKDSPSLPFQHVSPAVLPTDHAFTAQRATSAGPVLVGGFPKMYSSQDDGQTFTGGTSCNHYDFQVDARDPRVIFASSYGCGVQRSDDGGQTFVPDNDGLSTANLPANKYGATMLLQDPQNPARLFVGHESVGVFVRDSDDTPFVHSLQTSQNPVRALESDGHDVYAGVVGLGVAVSRDGGASWSYINDGLPTRDIVDLQWDAEGQTLYASSGQGLFRLVDGRWEAFESECIATAGRIALTTGGQGSSLVILQGRRIVQQPLN